jgi:hypothetical protein
MEILANESDWLHTDAENWAAFLGTETGKRLIPELVKGFPALLEGGDINAILIRSGEVRAAQKLVESLVLLAHPSAPAPKGASEYPPLEDDAAWNDGQKIAAPETETETKT